VNTLSLGFARRIEFVGAFGGVALSVVGLLFVFQIAVRLLYHLVPTGVLSRLALALDAPIRSYFLNPTTLARRVGLRSGMRVLHVGLGDGPVTEALARTVGPDGRVEAVALDPERLLQARRYLAAVGIENASVMLSHLKHVPYEDQSFDAICVVSALGRLADPHRSLKELWRVLRPAGRFSVSDVISDPTYVLQRTLVRWGEIAGLERLEHFGDLVAYTVNFRKPRTVGAA
jgi:SAM-dependent methyltransferase